MQDQYERFYLYVYGLCKNAGTLISIGSDEIVMSDFAEFGPLDVQLKEKEEIWQYSSGLNVEAAIRTLREETLNFFRSTLMELVGGAGLSTKTASEIATKLSIGFMEPILSQIDPLKVGEIQRAIKIALAYGERLIGHDRGNLLDDKQLQLVRLVQSYPAHGFVIDYKEAETIFNP